MVISVQKPQDTANEKTRFDDRAYTDRIVHLAGGHEDQIAEDAPRMVRYGQGDFLVYSRRQVDAETPAEYEY